MSAASIPPDEVARLSTVAKLEQSRQLKSDTDSNLRLVLDTVPSMMAYWNPDLRCRFANRACALWFGVKPEALVGRHIEELLGPELFAIDKPYIDATLGGQAQKFDCVLPGPGSVRRQCLAHYVPDIVDGQVAGFLAHVSDVSALKRSEEALRKEMLRRERDHDLLRVSSAALGEAQRLGRIGSWVRTVADDVTTWSDELHRIFGNGPSAAVPGYAQQSRMYSAESFARLNAAQQAALATGQPYELELEFVGADGSTGWLEAHGEAERDESGTVTVLRGTVQDVTERRALTEELAKQYELLQVTLRSIRDAVITTNGSGHVTWLNQAAEKMTGWLSREACGRPISLVYQIVDEETRKPGPSPVDACLGQRESAGPACRAVLISRTGEEYGVQDSAAPIRGAGGALLGAVLVFHDVTEQRRLGDEMSYRATHDALTGLTNRSEFEARLARTLHTARQDNSEHALMFIDLDQFKLVNDVCGHAAGDQLLQQVAKLLRDSVRARDTLARLGGDEFAVIIEHCSSKQAQRVAQTICDRMGKFTFIYDGHRSRIGASIGLVPLDSRWPSPAEVLRAADTSCYAAKEAGRNRVHAWLGSDVALRAPPLKRAVPSR